ncbi:uncharacterized protein LOC143056057 isoform X2 [Mytilus galloprovincialis]|uniref:uncharacterized protein LOC143056057 isoform X2 n=1 Tax=Mytilus galloprovincialis TaxID=29158 RepID=UPI003F7CBD25
MEEDQQEGDRHLVYIAIGLMSVCSIVGVIGNSLVLYVFSRFKQKLTSTIFILTLATTDFLTCLVTIPFTIAVEVLYMKLEYDFVCKLYFFLMTTTVPFSAFIMVAIGVDRYLCICHPFKHVMTIKRAKCIVAVLCVFAITLGMLCSYNYTIADINSNSTQSTHGFTEGNSTGALNSTSGHNISINQQIEPELMCIPVANFNDHGSFFYIFQKIYSSLFAICCITTTVLYALIYRSVLSRRQKRLKIVTSQCCEFWNSHSNDGEHSSETEHTEFSTLNNETSFVKSDEDENSKADKRNGNDTSMIDKDATVKQGGVSRANLEKMRMANIKMAFMLSIVTLVFIIAFLPSWLVALRVFDMNVVVFYLFFIYHDVNPVIYAFMNNAFRSRLKELFTCKA